jgi:hypothetical protein
MFGTEETHARRMLSNELGVEFLLYDDGTSQSMPDLKSDDGKHVAEVITTALPAVREAAQHLRPVPEARLPHCVWVLIPYTILGSASRGMRDKIRAEILLWTGEASCENHWSSSNEQHLLQGVGPDAILSLRDYDNGVRVMCVQHCQHSPVEPHLIRWPVMHAPSPDDPWSLIRQSLNIVDMKQVGGVKALADKLDGYPNKHLVIYPFGPPGNLTAALTGYVLPSNLYDLMPPRLNPPLSDVHLWLMYQYGGSDAAEGLHVCNGHWAKFGTTLPKQNLSSPLRRFHYPNA